MVFTPPHNAEPRLPELIAAVGLSALLAAFAFSEGKRRGRLRTLWTSSPVRMCLPDGTWVNADNLNEAGRIMKTMNELSDLPEAERDHDATLDSELD